MEADQHPVQNDRIVIDDHIVIDDPELLLAIRRPLIILGLLSLLIVTGTIGFRFIRECSWLESLYFAVITLTTVGSRDPANSDATMAFVVVYLGLGLGLFSYSLFSLGQSLLDKQFRMYWRRRHMINRIRAMDNHHIVCGIGRMGMSICNHLAERNQPFVVIDSNAALIESVCTSHDWAYIVGDATDDENLLNAGIKRCRSLASVLPSDSANVYVVLSARMLRADLQIVARASDNKAIQKMEHAGATRVISPFSSGGIKMARFMLNPTMESFVEVADNHDSQLQLIDFQIHAHSPFIGKRLAETSFGEQGVMILGIIRKSGKQLIPPPGSTVIELEDNLFAFGNMHTISEIMNASIETVG